MDIPLPESSPGPALNVLEKTRRKRRRRGDEKTIDWDAAKLSMLASSGILASRASDFCSNGSGKSLAFGSSGWSSTHTPAMSVFRPKFAKLHPIIRCGISHRRIQQEENIKRPIARTRGRCRTTLCCRSWTHRRAHTGWRRESKPKVMELQKRNRTPSPE